MASKNKKVLRKSDVDKLKAKMEEFSVAPSKFIPILFSTPMVQAEQNGSKTETRRTTGLEKVNVFPEYWEFSRFEKNIKGRLSAVFKNVHVPNGKHAVECPFGQTGDILWVRETFAIKGNRVFYKADNTDFENAGLKGLYDFTWKPSIHMPYDVCRTWLRVESIAIQRLQDISDSDAVAEGIEETKGSKYFKDQPKRWVRYDSEDDDTKSPISSFRTLWEKINGINSWNENPFVWVVKFKRANTDNHGQ